MRGSRVKWLRKLFIEHAYNQSISWKQMKRHYHEYRKLLLPQKQYKYSERP